MNTANATPSPATLTNPPACARSAGGAAAMDCLTGIPELVREALLPVGAAIPLAFILIVVAPGAKV